MPSLKYISDPYYLIEPTTPRTIMAQSPEQEKFTQEVMAKTREAYANLKLFDDSFKQEDIDQLMQLANWYFDAVRAKAFTVSDTLRKELAERGVMMEKLDEETFKTRGLLVNKLRETSANRVRRLTPKKSKKNKQK